MSWMDRAKCKGRGDLSFFPEKGENVGWRREFCGECPVAFDCAQYAIQNEIEFGIWGGLSPAERAGLSATGRIRAGA
jgi:WhiB family redox-sensing transcriptional regulator